ncbi:MAG: DUF4430 domain-containing protein [Clostridiales bacterium]|nr:DUF4430 domain-containing protein [Clostridiales bacterium]
MGTDIQSVDEYYLTHIDDITSESQTVTLSIRCDEVLMHYSQLDKSLQSEEYVPPDGVILAPDEYVLREGDTVFDLLHRAVRHNQIPFEYQGADNSAFGSVYVQGIHYLYEFSCGETSGWIYRVNGEVPDQGCSQYLLQDGDVVEWVYSCDLGQDAGVSQNNFKGDET